MRSLIRVLIAYAPRQHRNGVLCLSSNGSTVLADAFKGGVSGYSTGLQIQDLMKPPPTAPLGYDPSAAPDLSIGDGGGLPSYGGSGFA